MSAHIDWWESLPVQSIYSDPSSHAYFCTKYFPNKTDCNSLDDVEILTIYTNEYVPAKIKKRKYLSICDDIMLNVRLDETILSSMSYCEAGEELDTTCIKLVEELTLQKQKLSRCIEELRELADMDPIHTTCDDYLNDFVRFNGEKLYFDIVLHGESSLATRFWKNTVKKQRKKFWLFGPVETYEVPDYLFTVLENINDRNITKDWWLKTLEHEFELLGRADEINRGEYV